MPKVTIVYVIMFALLVVIGVLIVLSALSYQSPELPNSRSTNEIFRWGAIYRLNAVSTFKYGLVSIQEKELRRVDALYSKEAKGDKIVVYIGLYNGSSLVQEGNGVVLDAITYKCSNRYLNYRLVPCSTKFDRDTELAASFLPDMLNKNTAMQVTDMIKMPFQGKEYDAVMLTVPDMEINVYFSADVPLPLRIERKSDGEMQIANLKSYEGVVKAE
ncbi:MAG: hypothetical protein ACP5H8_03160 [Candidatus Micrarchaeia archaeon]